MIVQDALMDDQLKLHNLFFEQAQNGFYIHVADMDGKIIFTPEMYDQYRQIFAGLERFDHAQYDLIPTQQADKSYDKVREIIESIQSHEGTTKAVESKTREVIEEVLSELNIKIRNDSEYNTDITGAEIFNTGSTERLTNTPGEYDFDYVVRLDEADFSKMNNKVIARLKDAFGTAEDNSHPVQDSYQIRLSGVTSIGESPIDIDIGIYRKSELRTFATHDAVSERYGQINEDYGEEAYYQVLANVILAKQILKGGNAYKKEGDGGWGGIGTENWILANGGSLMQALETFWEAAHDEHGLVIPFSEFTNKYPIIDPGTNLRQLEHDNYTANLEESGYQAMIKTIGEYLGKEAT